MKLMKVLAGVLAVGVLVLGVGAWWYSGKLSPDVTLGAASPDVQLSTLDGQTLALSSLEGKIVLLDFWASY